MSSHCQSTVIVGKSGETKILTNESSKDIPIENPSVLGKNPVNAGTMVASAWAVRGIATQNAKIVNRQMAADEVRS